MAVTDRQPLPQWTVTRPQTGPALLWHNPCVKRVPLADDEGDLLVALEARHVCGPQGTPWDRGNR